MSNHRDAWETPSRLYGDPVDLAGATWNVVPADSEAKPPYPLTDPAARFRSARFRRRLDAEIPDPFTEDDTE